MRSNSTPNHYLNKQIRLLPTVGRMCTTTSRVTRNDVPAVGTQPGTRLQQNHCPRRSLSSRDGFCILDIEAYESASTKLSDHRLDGMAEAGDFHGAGGAMAKRAFTASVPDFSKTFMASFTFSDSDALTFPQSRHAVALPRR